MGVLTILEFKFLEDLMGWMKPLSSITLVLRFVAAEFRVEFLEVGGEK